MTIVNSEGCAMCGGAKDCPSMQPPQGYSPGYACVRDAGHDGKHVACAASSHHVAEWNDSNESPQGIKGEVQKSSEIAVYSVIHCSCGESHLVKAGQKSPKG